MDPLLALPVAVICVVGLSVGLKLHPILCLLLPSLLLGLLCGLEISDVLSAYNEALGKTAGGVGLTIVFGSLLGSLLERCNGVRAICEILVRMAVTPGGLVLASVCLGWLVSTCVFADAAFIIMGPVVKAAAERGGPLQSPFALALGLSISHTLVPPTPGPVIAARALSADLGLCVLLGVCVSAVAIPAASLFCEAGKYCCSASPLYAEQETVSALQHDVRVPSLRTVLFPVLFPGVLIAVRSVLKAGGAAGIVSEAAVFLGTPEVALLLGSCVCAWMHRIPMRDFTSAMSEAVSAAAPIVIITGAGGGLGGVINATGAGTRIQEVFSGLGLGVGVPILVAAALKSAQGSGTVAISVGASLVQPLMIESSTSTERALTVVALGAGSMFVTHVNDSFFWVVSSVCHSPVAACLRYLSCGSAVCSLSASICVVLLSLGVVGYIAAPAMATVLWMAHAFDFPPLLKRLKEERASAVRFFPNLMT